MLSDVISHILGVGDAAGEQDGVHLAAHAGGDLADVFADVQRHGVVDQPGMLVAAGDHLLRLAAVGRAQVGHQAAAALDLLHHALIVIRAGETQLDHVEHGSPPARSGEKGPSSSLIKSSILPL